MNKTTSGENSNLLNRADDAEQQVPTFKDPAEEAKRKKKVKVIAIVGGIIVAVAVLVVILVLALKKSSNPDDPPPTPEGQGNNPFNVFDYKLTSHGAQHIMLKRDTSITTLNQGALAVGANTFYDYVDIKAQLLNYQTARIQISSANSSNDTYEVPSQFQGEDLYKDYQNGLLFNHLDFQFNTTGKFGMSLNDRTNQNRQYVSTYGEPFVAMKYYMEIGFKIESQRIFGLGERTTDFNLAEGTYTLYPQNNPGVVDDGKADTPKQQNGMHPFLLAQLRNEERGFFGIYIRNSNAQQVSLKRSQEQSTDDQGQAYTRYFTHVDWKANGGILDIYFFLGPTYDDVLRQYHFVIGKPVLPPHLSMGLYLSNDNKYATVENVKTLVTNLNAKAFPFDGIVLSPTFVKSQHTFLLNGDITIDNLHDAFNKVVWVFPFSNIVESEQGKLINDAHPGILLSVSGNLIEVTYANRKGYCFDYFHPDTQQVLDKIVAGFQKDYKSYTGLWFYGNAPTVASQSGTAPTDDQFSSIPFLNDKANIFDKSIPAYADHVVGKVGQTLIKQKHFYLHGVYGNQMILQWQEFVRDVNSKSLQGFFVTESTFPGAGALGAAHVTPKTSLSSDSLRWSAAQILNFNMFGIPQTGHNVCGYQRDDTLTTRQLCVRSYQLALVTPIAVYNSDIDQVEPYPIDDQDFFVKNIAQNLQARLNLLTYQRTQLYKIQKFGGALVKPLFAEFPEEKVFTPEMVDTMMYGDALKVDFFFSGGETPTKIVYLPENSYWYDVFTYQLVFPDTGTSQKSMTVEWSHPIVLQRAGTVIPGQNVGLASKRGSRGLVSIPLSISVLLDEKKTAKGHVLIESLQSDEKEFYEIKVQPNMMVFKQQNGGKLTEVESGMKEIKMINIAAKPNDLASSYQACYILNDHQTVKPLVAAMDTDNSQLTITPQADDKLWIDQILFVVWGKPGKFPCDATLLQSKSIINSTNTTDPQATFQEFTIRQNLQALIGDLPDLSVTVSLQQDDSVRLEIFPFIQQASRQESDEREEASEPFRNRQSNKRSRVGATAVVLTDVVNINYDPFYIEVFRMGDTATKFFTTKDAAALFANEFSMYSFYNPSSRPNRFFGIGERLGNFWLQDNYQYSMFTNNHDLNDLVQSTKTIQFCKNGFFPIIYNQLLDTVSPDGLMGIWLTEGSKDIFFTQAYQVGTVQVPKFSVVQTVNHVDITIYFDLQPEALFKQGFKAEYARSVRIPPSYALGQYHLVRDLNSTADFITIWNNYKDKYDWPLEGFMLDLNFTNYQSLDFNYDYLDGGNLEHILQYINATGQTLIQIMKSGVPKRSDSGKKIIAAGAAIVRQPYYLLKPPALTGLDQGGEVIYPNYFKNDRSLNNYIDDSFNKYEEKTQWTRYGVQLIHNEINDVYCTQDCINDSQFDPQPNQFYKVGVDEMLRNSLTASIIKNTDYHNGYSYKQQAKINSQGSIQKKYYVSSANTPQSAKWGNVGHMIDYINYAHSASDASIALQSLSLLGMGLIGEKFGSINQEIARQERQKHWVIQTFSPLAAHQWLTLQDAEGHKAGGLMRYKYMLIKYTQTQLYRQAAYGVPLIRPVWISYPKEEMAYEDATLQQQYMYGDVYMVPVDFASKILYPKGTWCSVMYFNPIEDNPKCFAQVSSTRVPINQKFFFARQGTIAPLQDPEGLLHNTGKISSSQDLIKVPVDLHINPLVIKTETDFLFSSNGQILYYSDDSDAQAHCYVEIIHRNDTIDFQQTDRDVSDCADFLGFKLGTVIIYNVDTMPFPYSKITINTNITDIITGTIGGFSKTFLQFDLTKNQQGLKNLQSVRQLKFWP